MKSPTQVIPYCILLICPVTSFVKLWTYDVLNITTTSTHPEIAELDVELFRLARGRLGFSGFVHIKEDIGDDALISVTVLRSLKKGGPYSKLPFIIEKEPVSVAINRYYKTLVMPEAVKCCVNSPEFKGKFVPPLTKRYVEINSCEVNNNALPNIMMEGYYWVQINMKRDFEVNVYIFAYVENQF